jgi:hypothetical protein
METALRTTFLAALLGLLLPGCVKDRYLIPAAEARRAGESAGQPGERIVWAATPGGREVRIRLLPEDTFHVTHRGYVKEQGDLELLSKVCDTDRIEVEAIRADMQKTILGAALFCAGFFRSVIGVLMGEDSLAMIPLAGPIWELDRGSGDSPDRIVLAVLGLTAQVVGVALVTWGGLTWTGSREIDTPEELPREFGLMPWISPEGSVGGTLGFTF